MDVETRPGIRAKASSGRRERRPRFSPRLAAEELEKSYRGRTVVDGVSLELDGGEVVGLLGPNGAGKTTTFSIVVGLVEPDAGHVFLGEEEITELPMFRRARKGVGYLPQEASVFRKMTSLENLVAILETLPLSRNERLERAHELLDRFKLSHLSTSVADTLSGGERRRLEIARALTLSPASCSSTSRSPGSTRSRSWTCRTSSGSSPRPASASSSPTTTSGTRSRSWTAATSSTPGGSSGPARRSRSRRTPR